ncbi:MAG: hypothetical protein ABEL51_06290 [Salinibacter sp.]
MTHAVRADQQTCIAPSRFAPYLPIAARSPSSNDVTGADPSCSRASPISAPLAGTSVGAVGRLVLNLGTFAQHLLDHADDVTEHIRALTDKVDDRVKWTRILTV